MKYLLLIIYFFDFPCFTHGLHTSFYGSFLPVWFCMYFHTFKYLCSFLFFGFFLRKWDHAQFTNTSNSGYQSEVCGVLGSNIWSWGSAWCAIWRARITCPSRLQSPSYACVCVCERNTVQLFNNIYNNFCINTSPSFYSIVWTSSLFSVYI